MQTFTKESLIDRLHEINEMGWIKNARSGNCGGIGNTLEDLLRIEENNLPIPNAAEWELKAQRINTTSLTTLFHSEPSPRAIGFVPKVFLPKYGWKHQEAGSAYPDTEMSFRQTISGLSRSDRGFCVEIDRIERKILISFNYNEVGLNHSEWKEEVRERAGVYELSPQPYWGFDDLYAKARTKLLNCFYVQADVKREDGEEYYHFCKATMLKGFSFDKFLNELEAGNILIDFDARTGHNHGTKFRLRQNCFSNLYSDIRELF